MSDMIEEALKWYEGEAKAANTHMLEAAVRVLQLDGGRRARDAIRVYRAMRAAFENATEELRRMEAGPELDRLIAERVMGWEVRSGKHSPEWMIAVAPDGRRECIRGPGGDTCGCWMPSTDIAAAWEVVAVMRDRTGVAALDGPRSDDWAANFDVRPCNAGFGNTAPLAICRAALLAMTKGA